jgi:SAM-dependent methyltransferase
MIEFDAARTAQFFNEVYRNVDIQRGKKPVTRLHPRDRIFLNHILPGLPEAARMLDYGCGQGRLLATLLELGRNAEGMEKHEDMRAIALVETARWASGGERVLAGSLDELVRIESGTYDLVIAMGVFQYLSRDEYDRTLAEFRRLIRPGGMLVATFQNALFDLYTFNKYTIDFMMQRFVLPYASPPTSDLIKADLEALIENPDKPAYATTRARDNIFVHLTNPLTVNKHLQTAGFDVREKYFYEYFGLPPLIASKHESFANSVAQRFEVDNATAWEGHFMANAFLVQATRRS